MQDPLNIRKKAALPPLDSKPTIEDILNSMFPPKKWKDADHYF
jgi:hypothetical protein